METKTNLKHKIIAATLGTLAVLAGVALGGGCEPQPREVVAAPAAIEPAAPAAPTVTIIDQTGDRWPELRRAAAL